MQCPQCGNQNELDAAFCDNCGAPLSGTALQPSPQAGAMPPTMAVGGTCPQCGQSVIAGEAFCDNCGAILDVSISSAQPQPAAPPAQPPQPATPPQPAPGGGIVSCPSCGHQVPAGAVFCDNCGVSLSGVQGTPAQPQIQPSAPQQPQIQEPTPQATVVSGTPPRLVVQASGASLPFPAGQPELIVGREDPVSDVFPEINLEPHGGEEGGVSRRHAKFTLEGGQWYIQDLDSTNFTFVNKQRLQPNQLHPLTNGDEVRLGRVTLTFFIN